MDIQLLLVPYDSGQRGWRCGAGPEHLVRAGLPAHLQRQGHIVTAIHIIEDDPAYPPAEIRTAFELARRLATTVRSARIAGHFPLVLSGNCNTAVGTLSGLTPARRATFWFDAHGDCNTPETTTSGFLDGMGLAMTYFLPLVRPLRHWATHFDVVATQKRANQITQTGHIEIRQLGIVPLPHRPFSNGNSTKEEISIMKSKQIIISILAVLFVFPLMGAFAQQAASSGSIEVITTFDYPGAGNLTLPQKINERGDVVGEFIDSSGVTRGFIRFSNGTFSDPIVDPNDTVGFTEGRGINNSRKVAGDYVISDGTLHSFFWSGGTFTEYDVPATVQTNLLSINDGDDFTGGFDPDGSGIFQGFISVDGTLSSFSVPGAAGTFAYEINNSEELTVGYYIDGVILHGYYRDSSGTLHFPIDPTGSTATVLFGLNDRNWVVGRYASSGVTHGLFFIPPNQFSTFDYPGSTFTSINGINDKGVICGRYVDASGTHGFLARVRGTPPTQPMGPEMKPNKSRSLAAPLNPSPAAWGGAMPAR